MKRMLLVLSLALATTAAAGESTVSPYLYLLERSPSLRRARAQLPRGIGGLPVPRYGEPPLGLLVRTSAPEVLRRAVTSLGGSFGRVVGDIVAVRLPRQVLAELVRLPGVQRIEGGPPHHLTLDISRVEVGADRVEQGELPLPPLDGHGVLVGLVDTGIDYQHADFGAPASRVRLIWDQFAASGDPPPGQSEGALCDRPSITRRQCDSIDVVGHGTHVAATMASSDTTYRGLAPAADIIAVASIDFTLLVDSVAWLFEQAEELGRPMVVNLSLGGHYGPHDGTSLESQALSRLGGPGHIIVAAAGNEGADYIHLGYDPQQDAGGEGRTGFEIFSGFDVSVALFTIWHEATGDLHFGVEVVRGASLVAASQLVSSTGQPVSQTLYDGDTKLGTVHFEPAGEPNSENGKYQIDIVVEPSPETFADNPNGYEWRLVASGSGYFDAWSAAGGFLTPPARFSAGSEGELVPGDNSRSVGMPAVAAGIVAVASYATRASWTDVDGQKVNHPETTPGEISFFSSQGPSAGEQTTGPKPLVAAPGEYIVAARSRNAISLEAGTVVDEAHLAMRGTSMACPHVAGVVALMLQADPQLDPAGVERILSLTARRDQQTGPGEWDPRYGFGKVDAWEAVAMAQGVGLCESNDDCRADLTCQQGRCREPGGCGCEESSSGRSIILLLVPVLLPVGLLRRRRRG